MITGKLYGGLNIIGEAMLLKEIDNNEVLVMVLGLPSPIEVIPIDVPHGCGTTIWKVKRSSSPQVDELIYVES